MSDQPLSETEWRRYVEATLDIQSTQMAGIQAELIESDRLTNSVDRLGAGASELGEALLQVDRNQQMLTKLGREIDVVASSSATKDEVAEAKAAADMAMAKYRRRVYGWSAVMTVLGLAAIATLGFLLNHTIERQNDIDAEACARSTATRDVVVKYLSDVEQHSTNPILRESAGDVVRAFSGPVDCTR